MRQLEPVALVPDRVAAGFEGGLRRSGHLALPQRIGVDGVLGAGGLVARREQPPHLAQPFSQ